jgi:chemotaxis protein histidine kinase CheA
LKNCYGFLFEISAPVRKVEGLFAPPMGIDNQALLRTFAAESEEQLAAMEVALADLAARPGDGETARLLYRLVHTLEGSAATVGLAELTEVAHATKKAVDALRHERVAATPELRALLHEALVALRGGLARLGAGKVPDHGPLLARLGRFAGSEPMEPSAVDPEGKH